jgi:hypothetical protein
VERINAPHAEMRTAGVIMALSTDASGFTGGFFHIANIAKIANIANILVPGSRSGAGFAAA